MFKFASYISFPGTLVVQLEHSNRKVDWSASISGGHQEFISDYFTEERNSTHFWLVLAKRIDLEFISTDLVRNPFFK